MVSFLRLLQGGSIKFVNIITTKNKKPAIRQRLNPYLADLAGTQHRGREAGRRGSPLPIWLGIANNELVHIIFWITKRRYRQTLLSA